MREAIENAMISICAVLMKYPLAEETKDRAEAVKILVDAWKAVKSREDYEKRCLLKAEAREVMSAEGEDCERPG